MRRKIYLEDGKVAKDEIITKTNGGQTDDGI